MYSNTWADLSRRSHLRMALSCLLVFTSPLALAQSGQAGGSVFRVALPGNIFAQLGKAGPEGVFLETMDAVLKRMGKTPQYTIMPTGEALIEAVSGKISAATVVVPSPRLASTLWLSEPLVDESNIVVTLKDKAFALKRVADLKDKRLGARQGYRYPMLENQPGIVFERYSTDGEMLRALLFEKIDAILLSAISDIFAMRSEGIMKRLLVLDNAAGSVPFVAAFSKGHFSQQELQDFNKALAEFKRSPQWEQVLERNGLSELAKPWPMITE
jgi:ABC-type amino acid transport substrate-binding protein